MHEGAVIALGFAIVVVVLAVVVTRLTARSRRNAHDRNASRRDGDATATWIGVNAARDLDDPPD